ncbi:MAG: ABC transporter ATP-binding protein [Bacillota bacterium]|nr:ABC transporter ATP-binding protein [Bacillota bacterium]
MLYATRIEPAAAPESLAPGSASTRSPTIWHYLGRYRLMFWRGAIGGVGYNTLIVAGPILIGRALDAVLALEREGFTPEALRALWLNLGLLVVATAAFQGLRTVKRWDLRRMSNRIGTDLQADLLGATMEWPMARLDRERVGDLMSRAVGDAQVVADTVMTTVTELYDTAVLMLAYFAVLFWYFPGLTAVCSVPVPLTVAVSHFAGAQVYRRAAAARVAASRVNTHLQESLAGVRVLRLFGREAAERERLATLCRDQLRANLSLTALQSGLMPVYAALVSMGLVGVVGLGGERVIAGVWTVGRFTAYLTMYLAMTARTLMAARVLNRLHAGRAAWNRVIPKLTGHRAGGDSVAPAPQPDDRHRTGQPDPDGVEPGRHGAELVLADLGFRFPGGERQALDGIRLHIPAGSLVCITGPVGGGKSALAAVLTGLYPYTGSITLDGRELAGIPAPERVGLISYLAQDPFLFSDSVAANITFGEDAGGAQHSGSGSETGNGNGNRDGDADLAARLERVIAAAALSQDLQAMGGGTATVVGERGLQVSGGQRQRIALARALYRASPLLVLDDPFSAVDVGTERELVRSLREAAGGGTVLLFSHRLGAFPDADLVAVIDRGRIVEAGDHASLVAKQGIYARIYSAQSWMEEHAGATVAQ